MLSGRCLHNIFLALMLSLSAQALPGGNGTTLGAEPPDAETLVQRLLSGREPLRRAALPLVKWNAGHDAEYLAALDQLIESAVRRPALDSSYAAVQKLADCPLPEASDAVARALSASDWRLAMLAVDVLGQRRADGFAPAIRQVWDRPEARRYYALRHAVVCSLGDIGESQSFGRSVGLLPDLQGQLEYEAVARLTLHTGEKHGSNPEAWQAWWTAQDGKSPGVVVASNEPLPRDLPWSRTLPRFFELPIYSQRVVFVLDRSKSMLSTLGGKTRLEAMQEEFTKVIQKLPEGASFGLIVFNDRVEKWKNTLVYAKATNNAAAIQSIYALEATGKTAIYDALEAGFSLDENLEQIVLLTDGRPTAGKLTDDAAIVAAVAGLNRYRRVRIDCLGIDTDGPPAALLQELARRNFGTYNRLR